MSRIIILLIIVYLCSSPASAQLLNLSAASTALLTQEVAGLGLPKEEKPPKPQKPQKPPEPPGMSKTKKLILGVILVGVPGFITCDALARSAAKNHPGTNYTTLRCGGRG